VVPDEVLDMLEDVKGETTFRCKVRRTRQKVNGEMRVNNEVVRWLDPND
jgi:hypothetical protein